MSRTRIPPIKCSLCREEEVFECSADFKVHLISNHKMSLENVVFALRSIDESVECDKCYLRLCTADALEIHKRTIHPLLRAGNLSRFRLFRNWYCPLMGCTAVMTTLRDLNHHALVHHQHQRHPLVYGDLDERILYFASEEQFVVWKRQIEQYSHGKFIEHSSNRHGHMRYGCFCNDTTTYPQNEQLWSRKRPFKGAKWTGCGAFIDVSKECGIFEVKACLGHIGHKLISERDRLNIALASPNYNYNYLKGPGDDSSRTDNVSHVSPVTGRTDHVASLVIPRTNVVSAVTSRTHVASLVTPVPAKNVWEVTAEMLTRKRRLMNNVSTKKNTVGAKQDANGVAIEQDTVTFSRRVPYIPVVGRVMVKRKPSVSVDCVSGNGEKIKSKSPNSSPDFAPTSTAVPKGSMAKTVGQKAHSGSGMFVPKAVKLVSVKSPYPGWHLVGGGDLPMANGQMPESLKSVDSGHSGPGSSDEVHFTAPRTGPGVAPVFTGQTARPHFVVGRPTPNPRNDGMVHKDTNFVGEERKPEKLFVVGKAPRPESTITAESSGVFVEKKVEGGLLLENDVDLKTDMVDVAEVFPNPIKNWETEEVVENMHQIKEEPVDEVHAEEPNQQSVSTRSNGIGTVQNKVNTEDFEQSCQDHGRLAATVAEAFDTLENLMTVDAEVAFDMASRIADITEEYSNYFLTLKKRKRK